MTKKRAQARKVLAEALGIGTDELANNASPESQAGWDSLAHMRLVLAVETSRGRELKGSEILALTSLEGIQHALRAAPS